jgi:hypothetical protein
MIAVESTVRHKPFYGPDKVRFITQKPTQKAEPGINFYIPTQHPFHITDVQDFIYALYDGESPVHRGLHMQSYFIQEKFGLGMLTLKPGSIEQAQHLGYNVISGAEAFGHVEYRLTGDHVQGSEDVLYSPYYSMPLLYSVMKTLQVLGSVILDLLVPDQMTLPGIRSTEQDQIAASLHYVLSNQRVRHDAMNPIGLQDVVTRTVGDSIQIVLAFGSIYDSLGLHYQITIHRDRLYEWEIQSVFRGQDERPGGFGWALLVLATYAYSQIERIPEIKSNSWVSLSVPFLGHFFLNNTFALTFK